MTLHVRNVEINVEMFGLSKKVILDQVWINSAILITDKAALCWGYMDFTEYSAKGNLESASISIHKWNSLLGSESDTVARVHFRSCHVIRRWNKLNNSSFCPACNTVQKVMKRPPTEGELLKSVNPPVKKKSYKKAKRKSTGEIEEDLDYLKKPRYHLRTRSAQSEAVEDNFSVKSEDTSNDSNFGAEDSSSVTEMNSETNSIPDPISKIRAVENDISAVENDIGEFKIKVENEVGELIEPITIVPEFCAIHSKSAIGHDLVDEDQKDDIPNVNSGTDFDTTNLGSANEIVPEIKLEDASTASMLQASVLNVQTVPEHLRVGSAASCKSQLFTVKNSALAETERIKTTVSSGSSKVYTCVECKMEFKKIYSAEIHWMTHYTKESDFVNILENCPLCNMTGVEVETHYRTCHSIRDFSSKEAQQVISSLQHGKLPYAESTPGLRVTLDKCALCGETGVDAQNHYAVDHQVKGLIEPTRKITEPTEELKTTPFQISLLDGKIVPVMAATAGKKNSQATSGQTASKAQTLATGIKETPMVLTLPNGERLRLTQRTIVAKEEEANSTKHTEEIGAIKSKLWQLPINGFTNDAQRCLSERNLVQSNNSHVSVAASNRPLEQQKTTVHSSVQDIVVVTKPTTQSQQFVQSSSSQPKVISTSQIQSADISRDIVGISSTLKSTDIHSKISSSTMPSTKTQPTVIYHSILQSNSTQPKMISSSTMQSSIIQPKIKSKSPAYRPTFVVQPNGAISPLNVIPNPGPRFVQSFNGRFSPLSVQSVNAPLSPAVPTGSVVKHVAHSQTNCKSTSATGNNDIPTLQTVDVRCKLCNSRFKGTVGFITHVFAIHKEISNMPFGYGIVEVPL